MNKADEELLLAIAPTNPTLRKLYQEHLKLEKELSHFERYSQYSSSADLQNKMLKKQKLKGMEQIMNILAQHKDNPYEQMT
jgi:uncharacterized protein YdcH (DUF465 family)